MVDSFFQETHPSHSPEQKKPHPQPLPRREGSKQLAQNLEGMKLFFIFAALDQNVLIMTAFTLENSNWIMRLLSPLSDEAKLSIINRLSASLLAKGKRNDDDHFFAGISGAWDDGVSVEDASAAIRESRNSGVILKQNQKKMVTELMILTF